MALPDSQRLADEIAQATGRVLTREARRTERALSLVRAGAAVAMTGVLAISSLLYPGESELAGWAWPVAILVTGGAIAIAAALRWGWHPRWLGLAIPWFDGAVVAVVLRASPEFLESYGRTESEALTLALPCCAIIIVMGALRLRGLGVVSAGLAGLATYVAVLDRVGSDPFLVAAHLVLLGMACGLGLWITRSLSRVVQSEVARTTLRHFLPEQVLDDAFDDPLSLLDAPRTIDATILISDIRGFTQWSERRAPAEVLSFLNDIQGALAASVLDRGGMVDKFMGDGMLAVFGASAPAADHAARAIAAARDIQRTVVHLNQDLEAKGEPEVRIGLGLHSGPVVVGCLGSGARLEFTVIGDTVNAASRLEAMTKTLSSAVLVSEETKRRAPDEQLAPQGRVTLRGRAADLAVYSPVAAG